MRKPFKVILWVVGGAAGVFIAITIIIVVWAIWASSPEQEAKQAEKRAEQAAEQAREERFVAVFDSLWQADMVPVLNESAIFSRWEVTGDRETVTLTVDTNDWYSANIGQKKDIVGGLWVGQKAIMVRAGGDPDGARLVLKDKWGERLAVANGYDGVKVLK